MCPRSYKYHYMDKLRPNSTTGALLFGSALDNALNQLLKPEKNITPEDIFTECFTNAEINGKSTYIPTAQNVMYSSYDMDTDLLQEKDYIFLRTDASTLKSIKANKYKATKEEKSLLNHATWLCLLNKGLLMLKVYRKKVTHKFNKVLEVQKNIELDNGSGDRVTGIIDVIADVKGHGIVILDNKTSSMAYSEDSVLTSAQLSTYVAAMQNEYPTYKAGYIVMKKQVIKNKTKVCTSCGNEEESRAKTCDAYVDKLRCGSPWKESLTLDIDIQILIDIIPERTVNMILENITEVNHAISAGGFVMNLQSCSNWYGGKCAYYNKCYNGDSAGLEVVDLEKK